MVFKIIELLKRLPVSNLPSYENLIRYQPYSQIYPDLRKCRVKILHPNKQRKIHLDPGDLVVMYTDGVTDAQNSLNELYGMERFSKTLQANRKRPPAELEKLVLEDIDRFLDGAPQPDDMALVILRKDV